MNKIQGYRSTNNGLGFKFTFNLDYNIFVSSTFELDNNEDEYEITTFNKKNLIQIYSTEFEDLNS